MSGWISVHRKILHNPILNRSRKFSNFEAWMYLLLTANHRDNKVLIGNKLVDVKVGGMITSQQKLCSKFKWSNSKLRAFLKLLESEKMLVVKTNKICTMLSICNYNDLQSTTNHKNITKTLQKNHKNTQTIMNNNVNNNTNIVDRENKFINEVCAEGLKIIPTVHPDIIKSFTDYWTECSGTKMRWEMQKVFDIKRRLNRWMKNDFDKNKSTSTDKYESNGRGEFKVWCSKCGKDLYYKEYHIKQQLATSCCGADFKARRVNV